MTKRAHYGFTVLICAAVFGQTPPVQPTFEVASVRRDLSGGTGGAIRPSKGRFTATNSTLQGLLRYAYGVADYQIQGPGWMGTERYDIDAKIAADANNQDVRLRLQNLLAERFGLQIRREVRQLPVYELVIAKNGSKLRESKPEGSTSVGSTNHSIVANKVTLSILATTLSGQMDRPVIDSTGLQGTFDADLEWAPDAPGAEPAASGPSIFTALQEQLGLRLESRTGPVDVIVVDRANKIPAEN